MAQKRKLGSGGPPANDYWDGAADRLERRDAADLLAPLASALGAVGAVLSYHGTNGAPAVILHELGHAATDDALNAVLHDMAVNFHESGADEAARPVGEAWLTMCDDRGQYVLHVSFQTRREAATIVFSAVFDPHTVPDPRMLAATLRRLSPPLNAYFRLWQSNREEMRQNRGTVAAMDVMSMGVILIDRDGELGFTNRAAEALLAEGGLLRRRGNGITGVRLGDTLKLQTAIAVAMSPEANDDHGAGRDTETTLLKLGSGGRELIVAAFPIGGSEQQPDAMAAMLMILDPRGEPEMLGSVCALYGMSPVETRLACHLVRGQSLGEASLSMRLKEQTARTYLKQIFSKTQVNRQIDLVRLILSGLVRARTV